MVTNRFASYMAASVFPAKLLQSKDVLVDGLLRPMHLQLNPTNRCNMTCSWCSCANRDLQLEQPWPDIRKMLRMFARLGTKAATITGGGEPMLHPKINGMIDLCADLGIATGIVANGYKLDLLQSPTLTWCRISCADTYDVDTKDLYFGPIRQAVERLPDIDWAFSYVMTARPDIAKIRRIVGFAHDHGFTHVRLVSDLLNLRSVPDMVHLKAELAGLPGEELVIYQGRKDYTPGTMRCLISLIKPVIGADGRLFPCCGTQYALADPTLDYEGEMCMGHWRDWPAIMERQRHFDGSICVKCYYQNYNEALALMTQELEHMPFV